MARGNFRVGDYVCLYCGRYIYNDAGERTPMPFKYGKGANKTFLCESCAGKARESGQDDIVPHTPKKRK